MQKISIVLIALFISCASSAKKMDDVGTTPPATKENSQKETKVVADATTNTNLKEAIQKQYDETGLSSWYGEQFQNKPTASGEPFDRFKLTAAHRTLPFGTEVRVHNLENQKETLVRINDRGPFNKARIIDVSERAAEILDFKEVGVAKVGLTVIKPSEKETPIVAKNTVKPVRDDDSFNLEDDDEDEEEDDEDGLVPPRKEEPKKKGNSPPPVKEKTTTKEKTTSKEKEVPVVKEKEEKRSKEKEGTKPKGFTVQIGVFKEKKRAESFQAQMKNSFNETVFLFNRSGTYVVQIGDFSNRNDAVLLRNKVKEKGIFGFIPQK
jgi:rare lipoprotein A